MGLHLDKAQDLFARLKEMGAKVSNEEFMDIILASLPPSYDVVMNALTTLMEECGNPLKPNNIIRVLKAQFNKRKMHISSPDEQAFL